MTHSIEDIEYAEYLFNFDVIVQEERLKQSNKQSESIILYVRCFIIFIILVIQKLFAENFFRIGFGKTFRFSLMKRKRFSHKDF